MKPDRKPLSPARRKFRKFLGGLLILSVAFFMVSAGLYGALKLRYIKMKDVAPTLIQIDVMQHQAKAMISDRDEQLLITRKMIRQGFFSRTYSDAGFVMLDGLIAVDHTPSLIYKADLIMRYTPQDEQEARGYYKRAAEKGSTDAQIMLSRLDGNITP